MTDPANVSLPVSFLYFTLAFPFTCVDRKYFSESKIQVKENQAVKLEKKIKKKSIAGFSLRWILFLFLR